MSDYKKSLLLFQMFRKIFFFSICIMLTGIWGCGADLIRTSYRAADSLIIQANPPLIPNQSILIATFVNIDDLEESSTFGRTISEYIGSRISQHDYKVIEMKLRKSIFMRKDGGEFLLSRDLQEISTKHNAQAVVVGTYSLADDVIYVSARVIKPSNNTIITSYAYKLPLDDNTRRMLGMY